MADAYARTTDRSAAVTLHQGCGLTNAMTGITEAAKSRTPMVVLAAEVTEPRSNFYVDQAALARAVGAVPLRVTSGERAVAEATEACRGGPPSAAYGPAEPPLARAGAADPRRAGVGRASRSRLPRRHPIPPTWPRSRMVLERSRRPVFVAGRGAVARRAPLETLAERCGALLATSAVAKGLFVGQPLVARRLRRLRVAAARPS